jgi:MFS family permease
MRKRKIHRLLRLASLAVFMLALLNVILNLILIFLLPHFSFMLMRIVSWMAWVFLMAYICYGMLLGYDGLRHKKAPMYLLAACMVLCISLIYALSLHAFVKAYAWYVFSTYKTYGYVFFYLGADILCMASSALNFLLYQPKAKRALLQKALA